MFHHFVEEDIILAVGVTLAAAFLTGAVCAAICKFFHCLDGTANTQTHADSPLYWSPSMDSFQAYLTRWSSGREPSTPDDVEKIPKIDRAHLFD